MLKVSEFIAQHVVKTLERSSGLCFAPYGFRKESLWELLNLWIRQWITFRRIHHIGADVVPSERDSLILSVAESVLCHLVAKITSG